MPVAIRVLVPHLSRTAAPTPTAIASRTLRSSMAFVVVTPTAPALRHAASSRSVLWAISASPVPVVDAPPAFVSTSATTSAYWMPTALAEPPHNRRTVRLRSCHTINDSVSIVGMCLAGCFSLRCSSILLCGDSCVRRHILSGPEAKTNYPAWL